jgi:hypothetical protein
MMNPIAFLSHANKDTMYFHEAMQAPDAVEFIKAVVTWFSIRLLLVLSILNKWYTRQVDFILAYPQADIEFDMYMDRNWIRTVESG